MSDHVAVPDVTGTKVWLAWSNDDPSHHRLVVVSRIATVTPTIGFASSPAVPVIAPAQSVP